jgi:predicted enzyme related to lactoylglutathione lyase
MEQDADDAWTAPDGTRVAWFTDPDGSVLSLHETA